LQAEKQKAKRKEKKEARLEQLGKDLRPVLKHLVCLANPAETPITDLTTNHPAQADSNSPPSVGVPSLTQSSEQTVTRPLFHHLGNLANPVEPPTTVPVATTKTEDSTTVEEETAVNVDNQTRTAPTPSTPPRLKSVVIVVEDPTRHKEITSKVNAVHTPVNLHVHHHHECSLHCSRRVLPRKLSHTIFFATLWQTPH
jgi:hypothetical protein